MPGIASWALVAAVLIASVPVSAAATADRELAADVDALVQKIMSASGIPGLAIAVVQGDRPVLVKGYGFANRERRIPVTEHTAFYIGSLTKAFTALTVALLADRGTLDLDAPITRYLRDVQWGAGVHADSITLRQLLSHTSGIDGSGPVTWRTAFTGDQTNALTKDLLRHHGPNGLGHRYRYTNLGYNIAGLIVDEVTGGTWQEAVAQNVLAPLGMTGTTAYLSRVDTTRLAMPYLPDADGMRRARYAKADRNMQAAGGHVTTGADLAKWLEVQLNQGRLDGRQVFPRHVVAETQRRQTSMDGKRGELETVGYAFGWTIGLQGSDTVFVHGGGFSAFQAVIGFDLRTRVGVAVTAKGDDPLHARLLGKAPEEIVERVVAIEDRHPVRLEPGQDLGLGAGDLLDAGKRLKMHWLDGGDDRGDVEHLGRLGEGHGIVLQRLTVDGLNTEGHLRLVVDEDHLAVLGGKDFEFSGHRFGLLVCVWHGDQTGPDRDRPDAAGEESSLLWSENDFSCRQVCTKLVRLLSHCTPASPAIERATSIAAIRPIPTPPASMSMLLRTTRPTCTTWTWFSCRRAPRGG